ncbi:diguanylate cyclase domain-containing protein [Anabaena sp. UHCC 0253]|uniref:diguanylate cyclase domain-containing protein n=1 Tax=Anabaena sp. UHCC 0253 TaxID=2590019 RepID=UPI00352A7B96
MTKKYWLLQYLRRNPAGKEAILSLFKRIKLSIPGWIAMFIVTCLLKLGIFQPLEWMTYNNLFRLRGNTNWNQQVVVVTIDEKSLAEFKHFPWKRTRYIELLNVLNTAQPNVVVFDIIFSDSSLNDAALAKVMQQHGNVVLAQAWDTQGEPWFPVAELEAAAITTGHILGAKDGDGMIRKIQPLINGIPALGIAAIQAYGIFTEIPQFPNLQQPLLINWPSQVNQMPHYSFVDVVQGKVSANIFKNKIVLVGVTAPGIDVLVTPFNYDPPTGGVYLHAAFISNLFEDNFLHIFPAGAWIILFLLAGPLWSLVIVRWYSRKKLGFCIGLYVIWQLFSLLMLKINYWLPVAAPITLLAMTTGIVIWQDDLKLKAENQTLQHLVNYDGLTQIPNRRRFDEYFQQEWRRMARENSSISLILCDVDFFKLYNDTYGHQAGDSCLQKVAQAMTKAIKKPSYLVARYGGEEFAVILPNTNMEEAILVAEEIRSQVQKLAISHTTSQISHQITVSLGVAIMIPAADIPAAFLIKTADDALYQAKRAGRDRFCIITSQDLGLN